jgi:hypothetical protein
MVMAEVIFKVYVILIQVRQDVDERILGRRDTNCKDSG